MNDSREPSLRVISLMQQGRKIEAIKVAREEHGLGLAEAKDMVEAWARAHPEQIPAAEPTSGGGRWILLLVVAVAILLTYQLTAG